MSRVPVSNEQMMQNRVVDLEQKLAQAEASIQALKAQHQDEAFRRWELLFAQSRDIILFVQRTDGRILDANAAAVQAYGYTRAELLALTIMDLRAPSTQGEIAAQMNKSDQAGILFETLHRRKDGSLFPVEVHSQGASSLDQRILLSIIRDVTQRKQSEAERERLLAAVQQEKYQAQQRATELHAVIEAMHDPVMVYDRHGIVYIANQSAKRAHGFDPTNQHRDTINQALLVRCPGGRVACSEELPSQRALQGERVINEPFMVTNSQGQDIDILVTSTPLRVNDEQIGAVSVWRDITQQQQAERMLKVRNAALQRSQVLYRLIARSLPDGAVLVLDHDLRCLVAEGQLLAQIELGQDKIEGHTLAEIFPQPQASLAEERVRRALAGATHSYETEFNERTIWAQYLPLLDEKGQVIAAMALVFDITERKQWEKDLARFARQLEDSNRELEQFAFVASHDLQEPLRKIETFSDALLESGSGLDESQRQHLQRMRSAAARMRAMVNGLLSLSRVSTQAQSFELVELDAVAARVLADLEDQIERSGGQVQVEPLPVVEGDPIQLHQLLQNLIGNALKYQHPGRAPVVKVQARRNNGSIKIQVSDNGIGFDPAQSGQIFQPFQRLVGRDEYEGSGMGLAICRKIVERHGGNIMAQAQPAHGATFTVILPLKQPKAP